MVRERHETGRRRKLRRHAQENGEQKQESEPSHFGLLSGMTGFGLYGPGGGFGFMRCCSHHSANSFAAFSWNLRCAFEP